MSDYDELVQRLTAPDKHAYWPAVVLRHDAADAITLLQTQVAQLKEQNVTFRAAQKACEDCDAPTMADVAAMRADLAAARALLNEAQGFVVPDTAWDYTTDTGGYLYDRIERALAGKDAP
jgi:hypothetical protein